MTVPDETRPASTLAERQQALVRALVDGGPVPEGMDAERVAVTARGLRRKRARGVAHLWPAMRAVDDFEERFADWVGDRPPGPPGAEGEAFAASLGRRMPVAVAVELVAAGRRRWVRVDGWVVVRLFGAVRAVRTSGAGPAVSQQRH